MRYTQFLPALCLLFTSLPALASEANEGEVVKNISFCVIYATRLTQTGDSGLIQQGINITKQMSAPEIDRSLIALQSSRGDNWVQSYARKGSMGAMSLSAYDVIANTTLTPGCLGLADALIKSASTTKTSRTPATAPPEEGITINPVPAGQINRSKEATYISVTLPTSAGQTMSGYALSNTACPRPDVARVLTAFRNDTVSNAAYRHKPILSYSGAYGIDEAKDKVEVTGCYVQASPQAVIMLDDGYSAPSRQHIQWVTLPE